MSGQVRSVFICLFFPSGRDFEIPESVAWEHGRVKNVGGFKVGLVPGILPVYDGPWNSLVAKIHFHHTSTRSACPELLRAESGLGEVSRTPVPASVEKVLFLHAGRSTWHRTVRAAPRHDDEVSVHLLPLHMRTERGII